MAGRPGPDSAKALENLCRTYWRPIFIYIQSRGYSTEEAKDLTQQFFVHILEKGVVARANPERGRFRHFIRASIRNFLANEWDKKQTQKRGGGQTRIEIDEFFDAAKLDFMADTKSTPDAEFERVWALTLLDNVLSSLRAEWEDRGKGALFEALKMRLTGEELPRSYEDLSEEFGMSASSIKVAAHRMKVRFRALLRQEILETVSDDGELERELKDLQSALAGDPPP